MQGTSTHTCVDLWWFWSELVCNALSSLWGAAADNVRESSGNTERLELITICVGLCGDLIYEINEIIRTGAYSLKTYPLIQRQHPHVLASVRVCTASRPNNFSHQPGSG